MVQFKLTTAPTKLLLVFRLGVGKPMEPGNIRQLKLSCCMDTFSAQGHTYLASKVWSWTLINLQNSVSISECSFKIMIRLNFLKNPIKSHCTSLVSIGKIVLKYFVPALSPFLPHITKGLSINDRLDFLKMFFPNSTHGISYCL